MEQLNWVSRLKYTQAETDTHRYRVTYTAFEGGALDVYRFDDNAPYGRKRIFSREYPTFVEAQRSAEIIAEHAAK
jgi:hypothetical protein